MNEDLLKDNAAHVIRILAGRAGWQQLKTCVTSTLLLPGRRSSMSEKKHVEVLMEAKVCFAHGSLEDMLCLGDR